MLSFHTWKTYNLSSSNLNDMLPMFSRSVTRLGALLHFGQLFKAYGNNYFTQIIHMFIQFLKGFKNFHFSSEIIFGQLLQALGDFLLVTLESVGKFKLSSGREMAAASKAESAFNNKQRQSFQLKIRQLRSIDNRYRKKNKI